jgi:hypothetical protein
MRRFALLLTVAALALTACEPRTNADLQRADGDRDTAAGTPVADLRVADARPVSNVPARAPRSPRDAAAPRCSFRNVNFVVEPDLVLQVHRLEGRFEPTGDQPATFDDPRSFSISIAQADVALDMRSLGAMMNRYVFSGPDAPMRDLQIKTVGKRLEITGKMHKGVTVPFKMLGDVSVTPQGEVEIVPAELHAAGLPVKGLLNFFGVELQDLIKANQAVGIRVEENAMYLLPRAVLPPPRLDGRIVAVVVGDGEMIERFGDGSAAATEPKSTQKGNTMTFRDGVLRFGHLTMNPTDLTLVDADPRDPFLFSLRDYQRQLVAGYSLTLADGSLVTMMPDYDQADRALPKPGTRSSH